MGGFWLRGLYRKSLRDARRGTLVQLVLLGVLPFAVLGGLAGEYATAESRRELVRLAQGVGAAGTVLTGPPVNVGTIGGYLQWKYGPLLLLAAAFWSVLTLTRTLAGEAASGSLDLLAAAPLSRRRIAAAKVGAHLTLLAGVCAISTAAVAAGGAAFARLPGDGVSAASAVGFGLWLGLVAAAFGGLGLVVAQLAGRSAGAWTAGTLLLAGPVVSNERDRLPTPVRWAGDLTPWGWTAQHLPLAGRFGWSSLVAVAVTAAVLLATGVEAFARRDLDAAVRVRPRRLPVPVAGVGGPFGRAFAEHLPAAVAWGLGLGLFGMAMAGVSRSLADSFASSPDLAATLHRAFPLFDIGTAGGFLQLMVELMVVAAGFAAVTMVGRWAGEETSGRLEEVLAAPVSRAGWVLRSGSGLFTALAVMTGLAAAGIGTGAALAGSPAVVPAAGTVSLGLVAVAAAGFGLAVAGLVRARVAGPAVAVVVTLTYLVDLLVPALHLPDGVRQAAITAHLGRPMVGDWDLTGVAACLLVAVGGLVLAAAGLSRRDLSG